MLEGINPEQRHSDNDVDSIFIERWSPRAFQTDFVITNHELYKVIDAARWAPSSFNDQPWRFVVSKREDPEFGQFLNLLVEQNQVWAKNASAIGFIFAKKTSDRTGGENPCADFDCGAAWMSLTFQARNDGLYTHGMAGIYKDKTYEILNVPESEYRVICAFAIGKKANKDILPKVLQKEEKMSGRKDIDDILFQGSFKGIH